jgi:hypothetical protein
MNDALDTDWPEANQAYLVRSMAALKTTIRRDPEPIPAVVADSAAFAVRAPALQRVTEAFGLSPFERDLLLLCAGIEMDPEFSTLCAAAQGEVGRPYPSFSLALAMLPGAHWSALGPQAPLRRWRLIEVTDGQPLTLAPLRIDETVLHCLTGIAELDRRLAAMLVVLPILGMDGLAPSHAKLAQRIAMMWETAPGETVAPVAQLVGDSIDCRPIVAAAAALLGMRAAVLSIDRVPAGADDLEEMARLWSREICLSGFGVLLVDRDEVVGAPGEDTRAQARSFEQLLERLPGPVSVCERERTRIAHRLVTAFDVASLPASEQRETWEKSLRRAAAGRFADGSGAELASASDLVAAQFSISRSAIEAIAAEAVAEAARFGMEPDAIGAIAWDLCRARVRTRLDGLAQRIESRIDWDDLILPDPDLATLRTIAAQLRQRATVYERWGFADKSARGLGISALFSGPSGTGKTMGAEAVANDLHLDLYRIDLASVVSKYIGETEKNLRRVFDAADQSGAILLFDEADALFGKRSEVKDSHDRYANIEVSYLLQRMEAYRGLAILTTNMKTALDPAFLRRLRFIVEFPFPDTAQRLRIWQRAFPSATPTEALDFARLAQLRIAGGNIRSIAVSAAFLAADAGEPVRMSHLMTASRREYAKLQRQLTAAESKAWS